MPLSLTRRTAEQPISRTHAGSSFRVPGPNTSFGDGLDAKGSIMVCLHRVADTGNHGDFQWTENARTSAGNHTKITPEAQEGLAVGSRGLTIVRRPWRQGVADRVRT